jgi:hypothetical protein
VSIRKRDRQTDRPEDTFAIHQLCHGAERDLNELMSLAGEVVGHVQVLQIHELHSTIFKSFLQMLHELHVVASLVCPLGVDVEIRSVDEGRFEVLAIPINEI